MHANTTRFTALLHLAEQIAEQNAPKGLGIILAADHKWTVGLRDGTSDSHLLGQADTIEAALEAFVVNPQPL
jgi:hypothetical protein